MAETLRSDLPVIRRIIAAHRGFHAPSAARAPALERGWGRALRHAAVPFDGVWSCRLFP